MLILALILAFFGFGKKIIVEKRDFQEKILSTGNRIEITGNLIKQSTDLATLQAIYDIGSFNLAIENYLKYNDEEKLAYWSNDEKNYIKDDYIKQAILKLSELYFYNYNKTFVEYFMNPETSKERYKYWFVQWNKDMKIEKFDENEISINFGQFNITYEDGQIKISKIYPLVSHLKTKFNKTLEKSFDIIEMAENGYSLEEIKSNFKDDDISLELEDKGGYFFVNIYENSLRKVYDFKKENQEYTNLGLKFLINKGFVEEKYIHDLTNIKKCKYIYILSNKNFCDIFDQVSYT